MGNYSRRDFINTLSVAGAGISVASLSNNLCLSKLSKINDEFSLDVDLTTNEDYWKEIRNLYSVSKDIINLNNGGVSPSPIAVQEALKKYNEIANQIPSYNLYKIIDQGREPLRARLSELAGCSSKELAINRNATEALCTVINGLELNQGDEVVLSRQDYPSMKLTWKKREKRDGIVLRWIDLELPSEDKAYLISRYKEVFTKKTKVVHLTHMINWNGQVMPVKEICAEAKKIGAEVVLDAAHSFAQIDFAFRDLDVDYMGASLHKWLCAPIGTGILVVKEEKIESLYPIFGCIDAHEKCIQKFEHLGTHSFAKEQAVNEAIDFHLSIGIVRKQKRLYYLKNYISSKLKKFNGVSILTPEMDKFSGSLLLFGLKNSDLNLVLFDLFKNFKIHVTSVILGDLKGIRVSPNIYTSIKELDTFVKAIQQFI